jgi:hypothetical protein
MELGKAQISNFYTAKVARTLICVKGGFRVSANFLK